jgi:hypothetical protein
MNSKEQSNLIPRQLEDDLLLRSSTPEDTQALVDFNSRIHSDDGFDKPDERIGAWVEDLMTRPHPTFDSGNFTIVEDTRTGKIVSSLNLIPQTWAYDGIPFKVGRPEVVGTLEEYRRRGLVRLQFDVIHQWCLERGYIAQAITGIPYYYRQFGYEMAIDLFEGRTGYESQLPRLKKDEVEPFYFRPAEESDIPFIISVNTHADLRSLVTCKWDESYWRYVLTGMSSRNINRVEVRIIQDISGHPVGYLTHPDFIWGPKDAGHLVLTSYELKPGVSWMSVTPSVARYIWKTGGEYAEANNGKRLDYMFSLGLGHPAYSVMRDRLPRGRDPYAFFMRVPDLAGFLHHISPILEKRLADSELTVGYSGSLSLNFYRSALKINIKQGRIENMEPFIPVSNEEGDAAFPDLTFLQLLFGYRTFAELQDSFADCYEKNPEVHVLLDVLFPRKSSFVMPLN